MVREHLASHHRHPLHVGPRHAGSGIEVHAQLVGMVGVICADGVWIEVDAAQVDDPRQRGGVGDDDFIGRPP